MTTIVDRPEDVASPSIQAVAHVARAADRGGGVLLCCGSYAGDVLNFSAAGTSGALRGMALRAWSACLDDAGAVTSPQAFADAAAGLAAIQRAGRAEPGDKTLVDSYAPFASALASGVSAGLSLKAAWLAAAETAEAAARGTADLMPRLGRARPHAEKSLGHADAGAVSLARCVLAVGRAMRACDRRRHRSVPSPGFPTAATSGYGRSGHGDPVVPLSARDSRPHPPPIARCRAATGGLHASRHRQADSSFRIQTCRWPGG